MNEQTDLFQTTEPSPKPRSKEADPSVTIVMEATGTSPWIEQTVRRVCAIVDEHPAKTGGAVVGDGGSLTWERETNRRDAPEHGTCKGCGKAIRWIKKPDGNPHPVDLRRLSIWTPRANGKYTIAQGFESHFATCDRAQDFRPGDPAAEEGGNS